ncbi:MAG TPA: hypothetical protein VGC19_12355 [Rhodanobacter sp.]
MELDEMKFAWQALDRRLEQQHALNLQLFRDGRLDKLQRGLRPLVWGQAIQMAIGLVFAVWGGSFWMDHRQVIHLLVCGLLVHVCGLLFIIFAARNLYLIQRIDYAAPVLEIQRRLADLCAWRARVEAPANAVVACFIWIPVLWMSLVEHGFDLWAYDRDGFLLWSLSSSLVGLAMVVLAVWLVRRLGFGRVLVDSAVGRSVRKAEAALDEIARFEQD